MALPLAHRRFLVTRPENQSDRLAALLRDAGAEPLLAPMIAIAETADPAALAGALAQLAEYQLAVFVSPSALEAVASQVPHWPSALPVAVIGPGSRDAAERLGISQIISPVERFDSEGLLAMPELQDMSGKRVVLFRGNGGRELLADTLTARGASVEVVEAYRRLPPQFGADELEALLNGGCDGVIVTSSEAANNLFTLATPALIATLRSCRFFASHPAIAEAIRAHGVSDIVTSGAGDAAMLDALKAAYPAAPAAPAVALETPVAVVAGPSEPFAGPVRDKTPSRWLPPHVRWALAVGAVVVVATVFMLRSGARDLHGEMGQRLAALEAELRGQTARIDRDATVISQLQANLSQSQQRVEELRAQQADLRALYSAIAGDQDEALLADAELTLSLASQQLQLTANVGAALAALYRLDERLAGHEQARLEPLRRSLARDIDALKRVPFVDYVGLSARIDALAGSVDKLPLIVDRKAEEEEKETPDKRHDGLLGEFGRALGALVSIRRMDQPDPVLLAPQQALYLREHIKLRLLNARLALLQRDDATFRLDIADAEFELRKHFDTRAKPVMATLASLRDIGAAHPAVALPNLGDSLNAARDARRTVSKEDKR
ncbi:uroporphyrinogen-III C-methyltransferase [Chitinimonas sp.]|uniref:uroporphyrinogen-III C-methyltransferase n=1 Tax=Chitinimonas sp. TaxID=1934313 RepID=UPI0035B265C4